MNTPPTPNPYQPPSTVDGESEHDAPTSVAFRTNLGLRRHATSQYLLRWHSSRLLFSSLAMIFVSGAVLVATLRRGDAGVLPMSELVIRVVTTTVGVMLVAAGIYTALVYRTKDRIGRRLNEYGLASDEVMTLYIDTDQIRLEHSGGTYTWPSDGLRIHRTRRGCLVCPEPLLFIFIPKKGNDRPENLERFVRLIESRTLKQDGDA